MSRPPTYTPEKIRWLPDPDLLGYAEHVSRRPDQNQIWCPIRKKWIHSDPEEWVRQLWVQFIINSTPIGAGRIAVEKSNLLSSGRRYDLVVFDKKGSPFLLAEFKAPSVPFSHKHLHQLGDYNADLDSAFILWSNGLRSWIFDVKNQEFVRKIEECLLQYS